MGLKYDESIKFSIIIPVYNAKKYLKKCLDSTIKQTYSNYEVVAVDDGSKDGSGAILESYSQKYKQIRVIKQENMGESAARISGINNSTGDYFVFLDADDWYEPDLLSKVNEMICENDVSVVQFSYNKYRYGLSHSCITGNNQKKRYEKRNLKDYICGNELITYQLWDKAYSRKLLTEAAKNVNCNLKIGADAFLNFIMLFQNDGIDIYYSDCCLYNYRQGSGITSNKNIKMRYEEVMKMKMAIYDYMNSMSCFDNETIKALFVDVSMITRYYAFMMIEKCSTYEEKEIIIKETVFGNPAVKEARKYFENTETGIEPCKALTYNVEEYTEYLEQYKKEYIDGLTPYQKICRVFS